MCTQHDVKENKREWEDQDGTLFRGENWSEREMVFCTAQVGQGREGEEREVDRKLLDRKRSEKEGDHFKSNTTTMELLLQTRCNMLEEEKGHLECMVAQLRQQIKSVSMGVEATDNLQTFVMALNPAENDMQG